jgi:hypothetical protein
MNNPIQIFFEASNLAVKNNQIISRDGAYYITLEQLDTIIKELTKESGGLDQSTGAPAESPDRRLQYERVPSPRKQRVSRLG